MLVVLLVVAATIVSNAVAVVSNERDATSPQQLAARNHALLKSYFQDEQNCETLANSLSPMRCKDKDSDVKTKKFARAMKEQYNLDASSLEVCFCFSVFFVV
jgi:hypothetical protein